MRSLAIIAIFVLVILQSVRGQKPFDLKVQFFAERGFEVSIEARPGISLYAFHGKKNERLMGTEAGWWNVDITKATNGRFVYLNPDVKFNLGDILYYWIYVVVNNQGQNVLNLNEQVQRFGVPTNGPLPPRTNYEFVYPRIKFLLPRGFEVSLPAEEGMTLMAFHGQINRPFTGLQVGDIARDITVTENNLFLFRDYNTEFKAGDKLYYWLHVIFRGVGYNLENQEYLFQGDEAANHNGFVFPTDKPETDIGGQPMEVANSCSEIANTKINSNKQVCVDQQVFYEDFTGNSLDLSKWSIEKRFGAEPDFEFVFYTNESLAVTSNTLRIQPKLFSDVYGSRTRARFEIQDCTGAKDTQECTYTQIRTRDIVAPIVSSQITTKQSFSFQYGRIEVRAKLPRGDWIVPQLILEPKGFKYDKTDMKAGQLRVAFIENNPTITPEIKQGPVLGHEKPHRTSFMNRSPLSRFYRNWDTQFHTFGLEWTPDEIVTFIDEERTTVPNWKARSRAVPGSEAWIGSNSKVAPFDQAFFITLGVSVGGINDFSSGTPWDLTSPTQKREFMAKKDNWFNSWTPGKSALEVEYVKVIAL